MFTWLDIVFQAVIDYLLLFFKSYLLPFNGTLIKLHYKSHILFSLLSLEYLPQWNTPLEIQQIKDN